MSFAPVPVPRSSRLRNMEARYAVRPGQVIPAIQVASSGGLDHGQADRFAVPDSQPRPVGPLLQVFTGGVLGEFWRGRARERSAEVRVVMDHTQLKLDHL